MAEREVYLDHAATTPVSEAVLDVMQPYFDKVFGNPSSLHAKGREAATAVDDARADIAALIGAQPDEILFTSSGTESDNMAVLGYARAHRDRGNHIVISAIEHHAVLEAALFLEQKEGFEVTYVKPDASGVIDPDAIAQALRPETILVSVMMANNDVGTIQPIADIGRRINAYRQEHNQAYLAFHTDACQAAAYLEIDTDALHVDMLTLNGSKVYGPKGVAMLYLRRGRRIRPLQFGGGQERGLRPGTLNVPGIVGMARALRITQEKREAEWQRLAPLRDTLVDGLVDRIEDVVRNGNPEHQLPHHANLSFLGMDAEKLLIYLDEAGIYVSTGAACTSGAVEDSHVLDAMGVPDTRQSSALRFTLGRSTAKTDIAYVLDTLPAIVETLRKA